MFSCQIHFSITKANQNDRNQAGNKLRRASLSASENGAITLEASVMTPLFLMVMLMLTTAGEILMIHGQIAHGLEEAVRSAAVNEYRGSKRKNSGKIVSEVSSKTVFLSSVNRRFLDRSGLMGGSKAAAAAMQMKKNSKEEYVATITYSIKKSMPFLAPFSGVFQQKVRQKAMTGYVPDGDERKEGLVYVTPHESVYHKDLTCTHLALNISVDKDVQKYLDGKTAYKECKKCTRYERGDVTCVYVPKEGEAYHTDLTCSGLKRTVKQADLSTLKGMKPCERCGM